MKAHKLETEKQLKCIFNVDISKRGNKIIVISLYKMESGMSILAKTDRWPRNEETDYSNSQKKNH